MATEGLHRAQWFMGGRSPGTMKVRFVVRGPLLAKGFIARSAMATEGLHRAERDGY
jgi:hypothetical protein